MSDNQLNITSSSTSTPTPPRTKIKQEESNFTPQQMESIGLCSSENGSTPRSYLDSTVVPTLLEGMKLLVVERPSDPLAYLGRFLLSRSSESQQQKEQ
ncbi:MAG: hypothetical protein EXX96DRAFT_559495 [Benjaminiella poitrasii]|nr:MAG: hypothetical protein EXX96DRAFT_559495 [Benjaminiella poitrasii]